MLKRAMRRVKTVGTFLAGVIGWPVRGRERLDPPGLEYAAALELRRILDEHNERVRRVYTTRLLRLAGDVEQESGTRRARSLDSGEPSKRNGAES